MRATDSVVLLHDGPRLWLVPEDDGTMRAFRRPLPDDFRLDDPTYDWEDVFTFLPEEILIPVRGCATIALVPASSTGRPARVFAFEAKLPDELPPADGPLGPLVEARLGRTREYAQEGRVADPETLVALYAVAFERLKRGGRGR
ncbi:hypothetical protein [Patulibacter sp. SYSU D01012]|uniref:hypothetical protein n=1 Tax=Patulibacter sp. SYSU D01012 TaxID=2817381 RepID=UPI001B30F894|nr:hypothetical protein [Patulibacter sp. SYSU D01012]